MEWYLKQAENIVKSSLHRWYGFVALSFLLITVLLFLYKLIPDNRVRFLWYATGMVVVEALLFIWWLGYTFFLTRCDKNKTGLVICIYADTSDAEQVLKKDFISTIQKQLADTQIHDIFDVKIVKNHLAKKYNNLSTIAKLHKRINGHVYIYGETKRRMSGDEQYFMSLNGLITHKPVMQKVSNELSKDFSTTLPKDINFKEVFAFDGFRITAEIVLKSVQFIVGIASFISDNPLLAIRLHEDLKSKVQSSKNKLPGDKIILSKINPLLANEYAILALSYFNGGLKNETMNYLSKAKQLNENCYRVLLLESMIEFCWNNDAIESLKIIKKCHNHKDPIWRYNQSFLHFWLGQYPEALKQCKKIKNQNFSTDVNVSKEVTKFNENLITADNWKPVLYFWLGFNYYFKQCNLPLALKNLESFLEQTSETNKDVKKLRQKAESWLVDIKKEGGWE